MHLIDEQIAKGKLIPSFLKDKYESPDDRPYRDYSWQAYNTAYNRLSWQKPILYSEMKSYHRDFKLPFPLGVFVDAMRHLEIDDMSDK